LSILQKLWNYLLRNELFLDKGGLLKKNIIVLGLLSLSLLVNCDNFKSEELLPEKKLELSGKCSKAGKEFFEEYVAKNSNPAVEPYLLWDEPEFHYSRHLNTCLVHISYSYFNKDVSPATLNHIIVLDVFANKEILGSHYSVRNNTEEILKTYDSKPNFTRIEYLKRKSKLFSE
jgi:hypothetical protein